MTELMVLGRVRISIMLTVWNHVSSMCQQRGLVSVAQGILTMPSSVLAD